MIRSFSRSLATLALVSVSLVATQAHAKAKAVAAPPPAQDRNFGIGIVLGSPTALTVKYDLSAQNAIDGGVAVVNSGYNLLYADYLYNFYGLFNTKNQFIDHLMAYFGLGADLVDTTSDMANNDGYRGSKSGTIGLGARVPFGVEWKPKSTPVGVFFELVPGISVIPATAIKLQGGIGARYFF